MLSVEAASAMEASLKGARGTKRILAALERRPAGNQPVAKRGDVIDPVGVGHLVAVAPPPLPANRRDRVGTMLGDVLEDQALGQLARRLAGRPLARLVAPLGQAPCALDLNVLGERGRERVDVVGFDRLDVGANRPRWLLTSSVLLC
jgi:hypothetical protein